MASTSPVNSAAADQNRLLGNVLYITVGIILSIGLITGIVTSVRASNSSRDFESQTTRFRHRPSHLKTWFRRKFLLPALFGRKHIQPLGYYMLPTRGQSLMIIGYALLNVVLMGTGYPNGRSVRAAAVRAGHLSLVNMPIYFLFAGRNNILIFITGWAYKDFQVFHKWIARISMLEAVVHSAGYGYFAAQQSWKLSDPVQKAIWDNGVAATVVICSIICFSIMPVRRKCYELFLVVHILGAILFLVFLYGHVSGVYRAYTWICIAIWICERALRLLRLVIFNAGGRHTAKVRLVPGTSTILLTVYPTVKDMGFAPGAHYHIYFLDRWAFWESHPFTAAGWRPLSPGVEQAPLKVRHLLEMQKVEHIPTLDPPKKITALTTVDASIKKEIGMTTEIKETTKSEPELCPKETTKEENKTKKEESPKKKSPKKDSDKRQEKESKKFIKKTIDKSIEKELGIIINKEISEAPKTTDNPNGRHIIPTTAAKSSPVRPLRQRAKLTFLIHARKGMTRSLLLRTLNSPDHTLTNIPCLLEGPYGLSRPIQSFPTAIIIAGGVGVSTALPYLQQHLRQEVQVTRRLLLVWSVREGTMAEKLLANVRGLEFRQDVVVKVYITRSSEKDEWRLPVGVKVRYHRPRIEEVILREAKGRTPGTSMAVVACGSGAVVDCARCGVVKALEGAAGVSGTGEIVYWEEGYGW